MARRLALIIHFDSEGRSIIYDFYRHYKSLTATAKFCNFWAGRTGDHYHFTKEAVRAWLKAVHPDVYQAIRAQQKSELETRRMNKALEKPKEPDLDELVRAFRGED